MSGSVVSGTTPAGTISGSSQLTSSVLATTGSNTFVGTQILSGSILPAIDNTYDLGSATYQWRDIFVSSGSLYIDGTKVLGSTGNELQITTDEGQSIKILEAGSDSIILQSADGDIQLKTSGGGNLLFDPTSGLIDVRGTLQIQDGNKITSSGGNGVVFGNNIVVSGSLESTGNINGINLTTLSSSVATQISTIQTNTGSSNERLTNIENKTGSLATTGSNTFFGTQTFSGSLYVANDLIVQGSSSIQYISASSVSIGTNIVQLNTANPSVRFAGLTITDSGSVGGSGSFLYDSVQDEFIFVHRGNGTNITSSHFVLGPETYDSLGNETYLTNNRLPKGTGKEHLNDSNITDDGTTISLGSNINVTGSIVVSGMVDGVDVSVLNSNINTFSSSALTRLSTLEVETSNLETFTSSINTTIKTRLNAETVVSGSSQITLSATTGYGTILNQALLTSSSPTFAGLTINASAKTTSTGVDGTFADAFVSQYSSNNSETNAIQTSVSSTATNSGFRFQVSNGGGSSARTTVADFTRSRQLFYGNVLPAANGTQDLGSTSNRWGTIYTSDLSLNNGIGDWTIVEGEDDLFLYNNKKGKVYKFALTEVDPNVATPKMS